MIQNKVLRDEINSFLLKLVNELDTIKNQNLSLKLKFLEKEKKKKHKTHPKLQL